MMNTSPMADYANSDNVVKGGSSRRGPARRRLAASTPYTAFVSTAGVRPAQSVGVWGVGGVGAHNVRVAHLTGAAPIIAVDPLPGARERALTFGADVALDPAAPDFAEQVSKVTGGRGIDFAFDCAGCPPSASKPPPCWARAAPSSWSASPGR